MDESNKLATVAPNGLVTPQASPRGPALTHSSYFVSFERFNMAMMMAKAISDTELVPKQFRGQPAAIVVAWEMGAELGLSPMQSLRDIAVINGRPTVWGDTMLAICQVHPDWIDIHEEITADGSKATCTVLRRGKKEPTVRTFTTDEARTAGLLGKDGPWRSYPRRMLQMRARAFALRDSFADALRGIYAREEMTYDSVQELGVIDVTPVAPLLPFDADPTAALAFIEGAKNEAELHAVATWVQGKPDDIVAKVREAYKARLAVIRRPADGKASVKEAKKAEQKPPAGEGVVGVGSAKADEPEKTEKQDEPPHDPVTGEVKSKVRF